MRAALLPRAGRLLLELRPRLYATVLPHSLTTGALRCISQHNVPPPPPALLSSETRGTGFRQLLQQLHERQGHMLDDFATLAAGGDLKAAEDALHEARRAGVSVTVAHYNELLARYSSARKLLKVKNLFHVMQADGLRPDLRTYALVILAHHQILPANASQAVTAKLITELEDSHLILSRIFLFSAMTREQAKELAEAIKAVRPDFSAEPSFVFEESLPAEVAAGAVPSLMGITGRVLEQWQRETATAILLDPILTRSQRETEPAVSKKTRPSPSTNGALQIFKPALMRALEDDKIHDSAAEAKSVTPYLYNSLSCDQLAEIILSQFELHLIGHTFGVKLFSLTSELGRAVYRQFFIRQSLAGGLPEEIRTVYSKYDEIMQDTQARAGRRPAEIWEQLLAQSGLKDLDHSSVVTPWPINVVVRAGAHLTDIALQSLKLADITGDEANDVSAFYHTYEFIGDQTFGIVRPHDKLVNLFFQHKPVSKVSALSGGTRVVDASLVPMISVPKPWQSIREGGYLVTPVSLMRCGDDAFQHLALLSEVSQTDGLKQICDALNYLSSCPWQINRKVFDVLLPLFESEEEFEDLEIPPLNVPVPKRPSDFQTNAESKRTFLTLRREAKKAMMENSGLRSDLTTRVMIANAMLDNTFYLPHNLDFRGRTYVIPPHLSHLGNDLSRGLLTFAEKKPLGERGLWWLKVHLANLYGVDKVSFEFRVAFVEANLPAIFDSADDPLGESLVAGEKRFWRSAESPWQALAVCMELRDALRSPDPSQYLSGLPVHQDGTCNGLQHYAALGRDSDGARHVNLVDAPDNRPQDVYAAVCAKVNQLVAEHARGHFAGYDPGLAVRSLRDHKHVQEMAQELLEPGPITRKIIKQTVMTSVYGVTWVGGRDQIMKQLKGTHTFGREQLFNASGYLVTCVFKSLDEMFSQANAIKEWLAQAARTIATAGEPVSWLTPLGLPVIQPYHKVIRHCIQTKLQALALKSNGDFRMPPNPNKQRTAFPPNYIHSLDSTHMMYTALACQDEDIGFVAVHDSYWTHAATVDEMNKHCRQEFVRLHSQPLLQSLHTHFQLHYDGLPYFDTRSNNRQTVQISPPPPQGQLDIQKVLKSRYFFN